MLSGKSGCAILYPSNIAATTFCHPHQSKDLDNTLTLQKCERTKAKAQGHKRLFVTPEKCEDKQIKLKGYSNATTIQKCESAKSKGLKAFQIIQHFRKYATSIRADKMFHHAKKKRGHTN